MRISDSAYQPALTSYGLESHRRSILLHSTHLQPWNQILALAHVECPQLVTSSDDSLNAGTGDANATSNGERVQGQQVQSDAPQGGVGNG